MSGERIANAIDLLGEAARRNLDERARAVALAMLKPADQRDPLVAPLRELLLHFDALPAPELRFYERWARGMRDRVRRIAQHPRFPSLLIAVFGVWAALTFLSAFELVLSIGLDLGGAHPGFVADNLPHLRFVTVASLGASVVSAGFVVVAIRRDRSGDRLVACAWLERALLVAILVVQVFSVFESQFGAVFGLAADLLLLAAVGQIAADARAGGAPERPSLVPAPAMS
jgi:hypothetical protein